MSIDPVWEELFRTREWGKYPPEELIRFVARNYYRVPDRSQVRFLELGCGSGANLWFLAREGFHATGLDGSPAGLAAAERRMAKEGLKVKLVEGTLDQLGKLFAPESFDVVFDIACLQCNRLDDVRETLRQAHRLLVPGGRIFARMLAEGTHGEGLGEEIEPRTFRNITEGHLKGMGQNHFFSQADLADVFSPFQEVHVEGMARSYDALQYWYRDWVVQGVKAT